MKTLFKIQFDHSIDIITNSSSELFVLNGESKQYVESMLNKLCDYSEYELLSNDELSDDYVDTLLSWSVVDIDFTKKWKPEEIYRVFNGKLSKIMSKNFIKNNLSEIKDMIISKYPNTFYLFSLYENPNWETQEILMEVASKYHLG